MKQIYVSRLCVVGMAVWMTPAFINAATYNFQKINNNTDPNFNQLLGINTAGTIAGYFGDGPTVPNNGFTVAPPYGQANFTAENYPAAAQTQVIGINNSGTTVGFYGDAAGNNFGFVNHGGTFTSVSNPSTPSSGTMTNQLLGVNDSNQAAGFYVTSGGNAQAYTYNISSKAFTLVNPTGATASTATGINNAGDISGFFTAANGNTEGFYYNGSSFTAFEAPGSTNTVFFGLNNKGQLVGDYVDATGLTNGLLYNVMTNTFTTVNDPNASATAAFDVTGTTINGINDAGQLVGFYSDGTHVNGLLATATPEPASLGLLGMGALLALGGYWKAKARRF